MKRSIIVLVMAVAAAGLLFAGGSQAGGEEEETYVIKFSISTPEADQIGDVAYRFEEIVEEKSGGRIDVQVYPNQQLGTEQENVQDVSGGSIEMAVIYSGNYKPFAPSVGVLMLPYIFTSPQEAWSGMDAIMDDLNDRVIEESGTRVLGYFDRGFRYLTNSVRPVETIDDLQGMKIRVSKVDIAIETFKAWGIEPVPMAWSEVPTALQQRVIDGQENPYATIKSFSFYETQDYVTEIHYLIWTGPIIINNDYYESLPADLQKILMDAGKEAAELGRKIALENEEEAKKFVMDQGMKIAGPPKDEDVWQERAMANWPAFYEGAGGEEWVKKALSLMGR